MFYRSIRIIMRNIQGCSKSKRRFGILGSFCSFIRIREGIIDDCQVSMC